MVVVAVAVAFAVFVAGPAVAALLPQRKLEDEARPTGRLAKSPAASLLHRA